MIIFSDRLKTLREQMKLSQEEMAAALGLSQSYYGRFERNKGEPNLMTLVRISEALNVSIDYLLGFDRDKGIIKKEITVVDDLEIEVIVRRKEKSPIPDQEN